MSDQEKQLQLFQVVDRLIKVATEEEMPETKRMLIELRKVMAYEAAEFRLPHCSRCRMPVTKESMVAAINRDRSRGSVGEEA